MIKIHQLTLIPFILFSGYSYAADVTVNLNGKVVAQTCNVVAGDENQTVEFQPFNQGDFRTKGDVSYEEKIKVSIEGCTAIKQVGYRFSGEPDPVDNELLKVLGDGASTTATGLAIEILNPAKSRIKLNQDYILNDVSVVGCRSFDFSFYLRFKSVDAVITAGDASSILYLDFNYE